MTDTVAAVFIAPRVLGRYEVKGRPVFAVESPRNMDRNKPEIVGEVVILAGDLYRVTGVERHAMMPPIQKGERIGLYVEPVEPQEPDTHSA